MKDKLIEVRDSREDESRSVDLGHEVLQIFAISLELKKGEREGQLALGEANPPPLFRAKICDWNRMESVSSLVNKARPATIASGEM